MWSIWGRLSERATYCRLSDSIRPDVVLLSASTFNTVVRLPEAYSIVQQASHNGTRFAFGGTLFPHIPGLSDRIPGIYVGDTLLDGLRRVNGLLSGSWLPAPNYPPKPSICGCCGLSRRHWRSRRPSYCARVSAERGRSGVEQRRGRHNCDRDDIRFAGSARLRTAGTSQHADHHWRQAPHIARGNATADYGAGCTDVRPGAHANHGGVSGPIITIMTCVRLDESGQNSLH